MVASGRVAELRSGVRVRGQKSAVIVSDRAAELRSEVRVRRHRSEATVSGGVVELRSEVTATVQGFRGQVSERSAIRGRRSEAKGQRLKVGKRLTS